MTVIVNNAPLVIVRYSSIQHSIDMSVTAWYNPVILLQVVRMPVIRIDEDVYAWLQSQAVPFEDNPNSVLRRLAGMEKPNTGADGTLSSNTHEKENLEGMDTKTMTSPKGRRLNAKYLKQLWDVEVENAYYHQEGTFFENISKFPGALFDPNGYVVFETEQEYNNCTYLNIGQKLNVPDGIANIPGYKRKR